MNRENAIFYLKQVSKSYEGKEFVEAKNAIDYAIEFLEASSEGEWIYDGKRGRFPACKCSVCGHYENADWAMYGSANFCPNCGAMMKQ